MPEPHQQPAAHPWQRATPNALTCARIVMAGVVVALLSWPPPSPSMLVAAAAVFLLAAFTDALDGYLARRWQVISRFGRIMDPLADKILVLGAFVTLAGPALAWETHAGVRYQASGVAPWMAVVILARELLVTSIRGVYEGEGIDFSAGLSGKLKMIAQSLAAPAIMLLIALADIEPGAPARAAVLALAWATVIITAVSAIPYITRAARAERDLDARS